MAVEFKKLESSWKTCEARIDAAEKNVETCFEGRLPDEWGKQMNAVGDLCLEARRSGTTGNRIGDFTNLPKVKAAYAKYVARADEEKALHNRWLNAIDAYADVLEEAGKIADSARSEVTARKKKVFDSKSIPDLEKLAVDIQRRQKAKSADRAFKKQAYANDPMGALANHVAWLIGNNTSGDLFIPFDISLKTLDMRIGSERSDLKDSLQKRCVEIIKFYNANNASSDSGKVHAMNVNRRTLASLYAKAKTSAEHLPRLLKDNPDVRKSPDAKKIIDLIDETVGVYVKKMELCKKTAAAIGFTDFPKVPAGD